MSEPENPSVFPLNPTNDSTPGAFQPEAGMSLRDYFAGQALISMGTWMPPSDEYGPHRELNWDWVLRDRSVWAYRHADAMLAARQGGAA